MSEVAEHHDDLTRTLAARIQLLWDAYQRCDAEAHSAILADDYRAIYPDGTLRPRKPVHPREVAGLCGALFKTREQASPINAVVYGRQIQKHGRFSCQALQL